MDSNTPNKMYSVLVAGDVDLSQYDITKQVPLYIVYHYNKRHDIHMQAIKMYQEHVNNLSSETQDSIYGIVMKNKLQDIIEMTDEEYFEEITKGMKFDKEGNALTSVNPNGKYRVLQEAKENTAMPLCGNSFQCLVSDIKKPIPDDVFIEKCSDLWDKNVNNGYLEVYKNKETFIKFLSEFLYYNAFVSESTGWVEQIDSDPVEWVLNFREKFIDKLPKNTKLKVFNYI